MSNRKSPKRAERYPFDRPLSALSIGSVLQSIDADSDYRIGREALMDLAHAFADALNFDEAQTAAFVADITADYPTKVGEGASCPA